MFDITQLNAIKTAVVADPVADGYRVAGDAYSLRAWLNSASSKVVWRSTTSGDAVRNAIIWANMTPAAVPDGTQLYANRALYAQAKQISLQTLVQGQQQIASGVSGIRSGLMDSLTALPTKADGSNQAAGWVAVQSAMQRPATNIESVFAVGTGTAQSPADLVFEGAADDSVANWLINN